MFRTFCYYGTTAAATENDGDMVWLGEVRVQQGNAYDQELYSPYLRHSTRSIVDVTKAVCNIQREVGITFLPYGIMHTSLRMGR